MLNPDQLRPSPMFLCLLILQKEDEEPHGRGNSFTNVFYRYHCYEFLSVSGMEFGVKRAYLAILLKHKIHGVNEVVLSVGKSSSLAVLYE
jgi:hypothetical protein